MSSHKESKTQGGQLLMAENLSDTKSSKSSETSTKLHGFKLTITLSKISRDGFGIATNQLKQ